MIISSRILHMRILDKCNSHRQIGSPTLTVVECVLHTTNYKISMGMKPLYVYVRILSRLICRLQL